MENKNFSKDNKSEKIFNKKNIISEKQQKDKSTDGLEEKILSSSIEEIDTRDRIENKMIDDFKDSKDSQILNFLSNFRRTGELAMQKISSEIVHLFNSNSLMMKIRGKYVYNRSRQITKKINNIENYNDVEDFSSFLKTVGSDFWEDTRASNYYDSTIAKSTEAINNIMDISPEMTDMVLTTWPKILSRDLLSGSRTQDNAQRIIGSFSSDLSKALERENKFHIQNKEDVFDIKDDFLALFCMFENNIYDSAKANFDDEVFKRIDSIIEKNPGLKNIPYEILRLIFNVALIKPDKILSDRRRQDFLYNLALNNAATSGNTDLLEKVMPLFANSNYLNECPEDLRKRINSNLLNTYDYYYQTDNFRSIIMFSSFDKEEKEKLDKFEGHSESNSLLAIKSKIIKNGKISEEEISELGKVVKGRNSLVFLSWLIKEFPGGESDETALEKIIDNIFADSNDNIFDTKSLPALSSLLNMYNWSDSLKRKIYQKNQLNSQELETIFDTENTENSHYSWVKNDPILFDEIRKNFYQNSYTNNFRHYFFKVLDGEINVENLDDLINAYASRLSIDSSIIETLFVKYKIDKKYLPLFFGKAFNQEHVLNNFIEAEECGRISHEDCIFLIENLIRYGDPFAALLALKYLNKENYFIKEDNNLDEEKRNTTVNSLTDNILEKMPHNTEEVLTFIKTNKIFLSSDEDRDNQHFLLSNKEFATLERRMLEKSLSLSDLSTATFLNKETIKDINKIFPEEEKRREYFKNLFDKVLKDEIFSGDKDLIATYFSNKEVFSFFDQEYLEKFENKIFDKNIKFKAFNLFSKVDSMTDEQRKLLLQKFEKYDFEKGIKENDLLNIAKTSINLLDKDKAFFSSVFEKILNNKFVDHNIARLLNDPEIFNNNNVIRDAFVNNFERFKEINGFYVLRSMQKGLESGNSLLSKEEVKKISTLTINNHGFSFSFWNGYLDSDPENPAFYMDEDLFKIAIEKIHTSDLDNSEIIFFIKSIEENGFPMNEDNKKNIAKNILSGRKNKDVYMDFYKHNQSIFEDAVSSNFGENIDILFSMEVPFTTEMNEKILNFLVEKNFYNQSLFNSFCKHFARENNYAIIEEIKKHLPNIEEDRRYQFQNILLKNDLLTVEESREMYKRIVSTEKNIRKQILDSIKIISSMLSNENNILKLKNFFSEESDSKNAASLENISSFISRYKKEDKGRTVVTMLFAREYLPKRSLENIVDIVSSHLIKYEKILEDNSYNNIPNGIKSSVGMEYEITSSTASGYQKLTNRSLKSDIVDLSESSKIGSGRDAVHEIATKPTDNPYLMLLEMKLLHDTEYIDLNFDRSEDYQKGARGFHLTLGGERGLKVNQNTQFLQNAILLSSWGGILAGETGKPVNSGRGVSLRGRDDSSSNNVEFFGKKTNSVELRSLAIDKEEGLQRSVLTAFNGAIAIQAFEKCCSLRHDEILEKIKTEEGFSEIKKIISNSETDDKTKEIAVLWLQLRNDIQKIVEDHNTSFLVTETVGYFDKKGDFIEVFDFKGDSNKKRFNEILEKIDPTLSLEEYLKTTNIDEKDLFSEFSVSFSDKIIKVNNLFLKPGVTSTSEDGTKKTIIKGDMTNALSAMETTKLEDGNDETYNKDFLRSSIFDKDGERRKGYYYFQGGSEKMITHATQRALLEFNSKIESLVK